MKYRGNKFNLLAIILNLLDWWHVVRGPGAPGTCWFRQNVFWKASNASGGKKFYPHCTCTLNYLKIILMENSR